MTTPETNEVTNSTSDAACRRKPGSRLRHYVLTAVAALLLLSWGTTTGGCSREGVESPEHEHNRPYTPDDGGTQPEEEAVERVNAMLANADLRIETPAGTLQYAYDGVLFMESAGGQTLEAHDLSTSLSARLKAPTTIRKIAPTPVKYPEIMALDTAGWQLSVNGSDLELHSIAVMQADERAVWLRLRTPDAHFYWAVIPREW